MVRFPGGGAFPGGNWDLSAFPGGLVRFLGDWCVSRGIVFPAQVFVDPANFLHDMMSN